MITSKELMKVAETRGTRLHYKDLKHAMRENQVVFETKMGPEGLPIEAYLDSSDVQVLGDALGIPFNSRPRRVADAAPK
jgi:hypothetical protein